jgi:hypothetical protein
MSILPDIKYNKCHNPGPAPPWGHSKLHFGSNPENETIEDQNSSRFENTF